MRSGACYQRPRLALHTAAPASGSLLPTPAASEDGNSPEDHLRRKREMGRTNPTITNLDVLARNDFEPMLPTPVKGDGERGSTTYARGNDTLLGALLPTPTAGDGDRGLPSPRLAAERLLTRSNLDDAIALPPTPTAGDSKASRNRTANRTDRDSGHHDGDTLTDAVTALSHPVDTVETEDRHAIPAEIGPDQVLPDLRHGDEAQAVQRTTRGPEQVPLSSDLLTGVREHQGDRGTAGAALASEAAPREFMQGLRGHRDAARSPHGSEPGEQRPGESGDALRVLPPETALAGGSALWGRYAPAVRRWELILGRPAPHPTHGKAVNARAVEWMMGLTAGWVTDLIPNRRALKVLGNGVVPQCAAAAIATLAVALEAA